MQNVPRRSLGEAAAPSATKPTRSVHRGVPGEGCPWEHSRTRSQGADGDKVHPKHKERPACLAKPGLWGGNRPMHHPLLTGWGQHQPQGAHSQPWDRRIHPRHLSGACWDELGAGAWVWQAALAEAQGSDPGGAGRSGEHRERIYLPQESAWRGCRNRNHLHAWKRNLLPHDKATGSQWC